jgi:hypothetical protein
MPNPSLLKAILFIPLASRRWLIDSSTSKCSPAFRSQHDELTKKYAGENEFRANFSLPAFYACEIIQQLAIVLAKL